MVNGGDGHDNSGDPFGKKDDKKDKSNVIPLKVPRKKKTQTPTEKVKTTISSSSSSWGKNVDDTAQSLYGRGASKEQMLNIPPFTKYMLGSIILIHVIVAVLLNAEQTQWVYIHLGFIPGRFTGAALFEPLALLTPFTHIFIHGGWLHLAMNAVMLLAFGSGVERWMGGRKMIAFFVLCSLFGMAAHFALNFHSYQPVIGASGGLSGLFAAALVMLNRRHNNMNGKYGYLPLIALWVVVSVLFGMMGSPDGGDIAWAAHVGGFLGGFLILKWMKI